MSPLACAVAFDSQLCVNHYMCGHDVHAGLIWAFVGPACAILAVNVVLFLMIMRVIVQVHDPLPLLLHLLFLAARG